MVSTELREATKTAHLELERKVIQKLKDIRSNSDYADLLSYFYAYFSRLEQAIEPHITGDILPDYKERRKADRLKNDMADLGSADTPLPQTETPVITNPLEAMGALYVMEGSVMGGGIIIKMLAEKGGITQGISFFSGYGEATREKWTEFTAILDKLATTPEEKQAVINAANQTFERFSASMN